MTLTFAHVLISLIGIAAGLVVLLGMAGGRGAGPWTAIFLATTTATSLSGYLFPIHGLTPGHVVGALSLIVLTLAALALYRFQLAGPWRRTYAVCATTAFYFNVFVAVIQAFDKVPALKAASGGPVVGITQLAVLVSCIALGVAAGRGLRQAFH